VIKILEGGPLPSGERVRMLAALLASGHAIDERLVVSLAAPRADEGEESPARRPGTAADWLDNPRAHPSPAPRVLRHAADRLQRLARSPDRSARERLVLERAEAATALAAVQAFALAGDAPGAVEIVDRTGARLFGSGASRALLRSTIWYVAADPGRALAEVDRGPPDLDVDASLSTAWWVQKAELLASNGRRDEAGRAARVAAEAAARSGDHGLVVRALWTRLVLTRAPLSPLPGDRSRPLAGVAWWPWTGAIATPASWLAPSSEGWTGDAGAPAAILRARAFWEAALTAPPEQRRAIRYAAARAHRGDAPRASSVYLALAADLLHEDEGDVEVWLDAFSATWSRRGTLRAYAWARAEAARFRGDAEAASQWTRRYRTLVSMAAVEDGAELAAALGI
jgi:hypothetical protein